MATINYNGSKLDVDKKRELASALTETTAKVIGLPKECVVVYINEFEKENIAVGGTLISEKKWG